jgi:hypothetical protein
MASHPPSQFLSFSASLILIEKFIPFCHLYFSFFSRPICACMASFYNLVSRIFLPGFWRISARIFSRILAIFDIFFLQMYKSTRKIFFLLHRCSKRRKVIILFVLKGTVHRKKAFRYSRPQPGCHLPKSPWAGKMTSYINYSRLARVWSVTSAGDGNIEKLFYGVA